MESMIRLLETVSAIPSLDARTRERANYLAFVFRCPRGLYHWLRR